MKNPARSIPPAWLPFIPYALLALAIFLAYGNVYPNEFLFDDGLLITGNHYLQHWSDLRRLLAGSTTAGAHITGGFYRPVQMALYFFVYQIAGLSTSAYHLLNILIHTANACLLFALAEKLKFDPWAAFFAVLIWALHPIHTEAITYMSSTADTLHVLFILLGLVILLPDFNWKKVILTLPVFVLGLLSKEVAIVFPALAMCCLYVTSSKRLDARMYIKTIPFWLIAFAFIAWRLTNTGLDGPASYNRIFQLPEYASLKIYSEHFELRLYTLLATLPAYLQLMLWPADLHMERSFIIYNEFWVLPVMFGAAMVLAAFLQIIKGHGKKELPLTWGLLWFGISHFPDSGLLIPINSLFLEHWMYLPTAGLFIGSAQYISLRLTTEKAKKAKPYIATACVMVALVCGVATFLQNYVWRDPVTFYTHLFHEGVSSARAHNNIALAYMEKNEYQMAIEEFHRAMAISDTYAETHHNLAVSLMSMPKRQEHVGEAVAELNRAIAIDPKFFRSYIMLSQIYAFLGDSEKADENRQKAEKILNELNR